MSIQTATDLILDVVKAADPAVAKRAEAMLEAASIRRTEQAASTPAFERQLLASADPGGVAVPKLPSADDSTDRNLESYQRFEAMVLQSFIGAMLPQDSEELYGKGTAGEIWKGMMAEQLGNALARGGGIGIAERMLANQIGAAVRPEAADGINSNVSNRAANLVNEIQTRILTDVAGADEPGNSTYQSARRA